MARPLSMDQARFVRSRHLPGVELVSVAYRARSFPEHCHDEFVIGAVTAGAEALTVRGVTHIADAGSVLRLHPGEAHANAAIGAATLRYSVLYVPGDAFAPYFGEVARLRFAAPVTRDPRLYRLVREVHAALASPATGKLEQESALAALARMVGAAPECGAGLDRTQRTAVEQVRQFVDQRLCENIGLSDLSALTGLSPFHLVRTFKKSVGLSPLAYRNQRRVAAARRLLAEGQPIVQVALDLGYADQSHFTRQFQRLVGVSPQRYARGVSASAP